MIPNYFKILIAFILLNISINAQNIGGTHSNQNSPKEVKASELNKGAYTSDVNLFTGTMATSYDLGSVSTFAGLSYKLQLNYSTSRSTGSSPNIVAGIPYGEGWNINLPTVSVSAEAYQKFTASDISGMYPNISTPPLLFSKEEALKEGASNWFAPFISIPGVVSDRFILKTVDTLKNEPVFVCNNMEHYIEARLRFGSQWQVTNFNGDIYEFNIAMTSYRAPSQLNYTADSLRLLAGVSKQNLIPKEEPLTWYCTTIYNKNNPQDQSIAFYYDGFGTFDFYKEFQQPTLNQVLGVKLGNSLGIASFKVQKEILLTGMESYSNRGSIEKLELNYKTQTPAYSPNMLTLAEKSVQRLDSMYNYRIVYSQGVDNVDSSYLHSNAYNYISAGLSFNYGLNKIQPDFNSWRRYMHVMNSDPISVAKRSYIGYSNFQRNNPNFASNSNPYLVFDPSVGGNAMYMYRNISPAPSELPFDHGYLESPRITNDIVPGDIYEVRSVIKDYNVSSSSSLKLCLFDINIVSGSPLFNPNGTSACGTTECGDGSTSVSPSDYVYGLRGLNIYSTFNNPVKWNSQANNFITSNNALVGSVVTSNYFVMPYMPDRFTGINVQIGPANSDHDFSLEQTDAGTHLGFTYSSYIQSTYHAYKTLQAASTGASSYAYPNEKIKSPHTKPPHNFGIGMPWMMMNEVYSDLVDNTYNNLSSKYRFWWKDINNPITPLVSFANVPTAADANVKLAAFEIVRYSKNPYMLCSVKKFKYNGYAYKDSILKNKYLVNQLNIKYDFRYDTLFTNIYTYQPLHYTKDTIIDCYNYTFVSGGANNASVKTLKSKELFGMQNTYLLKSITQIPVNSALANAPFTYVEANMPTTHFNYSLLKTDSMKGFNTRYDFTGNIFVLSKITDQLGGIMTYDYYPLHDTKRTHYMSTYVDNNYSGIIPYNTYNMPSSDVYKVQITVRSKKYYNSALTLLPTKIWSYDYTDFVTSCNLGNPKTVKSITINTGFNYIHNASNAEFGFRTTTVKYPKLISTSTSIPYDVYTHYNTENRLLTFGKLKMVQKFDASNLLLNKKEYIYKATMAYGNLIFTDNEVVSNVSNDDQLEVWGIYTNNPNSSVANYVKTRFANKTVIGTSDLDIDFLEINNPYLFDIKDKTYLNSYFVRLVKEINTDYDYSAKKSDVEITDSKTGGIKLIDIVAIEGGASGNAFKKVLISGESNPEPLSGINSLKLSFVTKPELFTAIKYLSAPTSISSITEYDYWDSDSIGNTTSDGFRKLLNTDSNMTNTIRLIFEPSWELFRAKTYSPELVGAYSTSENFYYYDVKQVINNAGPPYYPTMNKFDALYYSHKSHIRNLPYQKLIASKAVNQPEIAKSEYYWYDTKTQTDLDFIYDTLDITGLNNYCASGMRAPFLPPNTNQANLVGSLLGNTTQAGLKIPLLMPNDLNTKLVLRKVAQQIDTVYDPTSDYPYNNHYHHILRFKDMFVSGSQPYYVWQFPFNVKMNYQTLSHTPMGFVRKELNERNLLTTYYYPTMYSTTIIDNNMACNNGGAFNLTNQGVPKCITIGANQVDSLQTCYRYNKDFTIDSIIDPNGMILSYKYDNFSRLRMARRNNDTLSLNEYSQWLNDTTLNFEQRAEQNYVESYILLNKGSKVAERSRAYIDPLGRKYDVQTQISANYTNPLVYDTLMIHSGLTTYDNWDRVSRQYKPFKFVNVGGTPINFAPRFNPPTALYTQQQYEPNQRGRALRAAKFGENISTGHTVNSSYQIISGYQLKYELSLVSPNLLQVAGTISNAILLNQRYLKTASIDEDAKKVVSFTNVLGQKVATKTYANGAGFEVTAFVYDSQGNLKKVINPKQQVTTYEYNLTGNMYRKVSTDADTVKYMYDVSGKVVLEQDANAKLGIGEPTNQPYMRRYTYDDYGRLILQERVTDPYHNTLKYTSDVIPNPLTNGTQYYDFTYSSTYYFMGGWRSYNCAGFNCFTTITYPDANINSLATEKQFIYRYTANYNYGGSSYTPFLGSVITAYLNANPPSSPNGQHHLKGRLSLALSYDNLGVVSNLNIYSYNNEGLIERELIQFNVPNTTTKLNSIITYPAYNLRNSLLTQQVDANADNIVDMEYHYTYDGWNRLRALDVKQGLGTTKKLIDYNYDDALGLLAHSILYSQAAVGCSPNIDAMVYNYDARNRLTSMASKFYTEKLFYDGNAPTTANPAFAVTPSYNYNGNINGINHQCKLNSAVNYASTAGVLDSATVYGYKYDGLNRLTKADASVLNVLLPTQSPAVQAQKLTYGDETLKYDAIGNIQTLNRGLYYATTAPVAGSQQQNWVYNYAPNKNQLTHVDSTNYTPLRTYVYDKNGNQTNQTINAQSVGSTYMRGNLINQNTVGTMVINSYYNANDDRVYKYNQAGSNLKTYYLRDASGKELAEYDLVSNSWTHYAHGRDRVAEYKTNMITNFFVTDHLGSVRVLYNTDNACIKANIKYTIVSCSDNYAFGRNLRSFNNTNKYAYQGSEKEKELSDNDYYTHFRELNTEIARWWQVDPKVDEQMNWSPYVSMNNNPVSNIDPLGDIVKVHGNIFQQAKFWLTYAFSSRTSAFKQNVNFQRTNQIGGVDQVYHYNFHKGHINTLLTASNSMVNADPNYNPTNPSPNQNSFSANFGNDVKEKIKGFGIEGRNKNTKEFHTKYAYSTVSIHMQFSSNDDTGNAATGGDIVTITQGATVILPPTVMPFGEGITYDQTITFANVGNNNRAIKVTVTDQNGNTPGAYYLKMKIKGIK